MVPDWAGYLMFRDGLAEAMDRRLFSPEWLDWAILNGDVQFRRTAKAAITFQLKLYPTGAAVLRGLYATGDLKHIIGLLIPQAEEWGREQGCRCAQISSREAWGRLLEPYGYTSYKVTLWKDL